MYRPKTCELCQKSFTPTNGTQRWCGGASPWRGCCWEMHKAHYRLDKVDKNHKFTPKHRLVFGVSRSSILKRDNSTCQKCGMLHSKGWFFDIDHKDGDWRNHKADNLWLLCPNCHRIKTHENHENKPKGIKRPRHPKPITVQVPLVAQ